MANIVYVPAFLFDHLLFKLKLAEEIHG